MTKNKAVNLILDILFLAILIVADQYTKAIAVFYLKDKPAIPLISGILELNYLENRGAAFGMMQNQKIFFIFVAVIIIGCIIYILVKAPTQPKYIILHILLTFIAGGAIGNMIDRISLNYVVDFIYIKAINFPIFNVADIYVTCATIVLVLIILFFYKDNDLRFLSFRAAGFRTLSNKTADGSTEESKDISQEESKDVSQEESKDISQEQSGDKKPEDKQDA